MDINKHLYSVRKIQKLLNISRTTKHRYNNYELPESKKLKCKVINLVVQIWEDSKRRYGAPKIRYLLVKLITKYPMIEMIHSDQGRQYTTKIIVLY